VRLDKLEKEVEVACLWRKNAIACLDRLEEKVSKFLVELDAFASPHFDHDDFRELKSQIYKAESQIRINNDSLTGYAYALEERIKQLEKLNQQCFEANPIAAIDKRFQELEGKIKKLEGQQEFTSALLNAHVQVSKIPYKCPLCDGIGKKMKYEIHVDGEPVGNSYQPENCLSCEGKGIVWA
jgi:DNA repair exonuclease SbcCD ATPase subunit